MIPPAVFRKAIRRAERDLLGSRGLWLCRLEHRALEADQQIGTADDLPPALNGGIVGDPIIGPAQRVFALFEAVFDPGPQSIGIADRFLDLALQVRHDILGALHWECFWVSGDLIVTDLATFAKTYALQKQASELFLTHSKASHLH